MPLWSNINYSSGNTKPKFGFPPYPASGNVDPGANGADLIGVTASAYSNTTSGAFLGKGGPGHAGWINIRLGRGWIRDVLIANSGNNIANGAVATVTGGNGGFANIVVTAVNGGGTVGNVTSIRIVATGNNYNSLPTISIANNATTGFPAVLTPLAGGRLGRFEHEVLVAMGSLSGAPNPANNFFGM
jgi:hypothetical protein